MLQPKGKVPLLLLESINKDALFPGDLFHVVYQPYRVLKSNLQYVIDTSVCHMTLNAHDSKRVLAVSFISELNCEAGLRFDIEMYISESLATDAQMKLVVQHIIKSLVYLGKQSSDTDSIDVHIPLNFPVSVPSLMIEEWITDKFGWSLGPWSTSMAGQNYIGCEMSVSS